VADTGGPWRLEGEAILAFTRAALPRTAEPAPASRRLPGPLVIAAVRSTHSPVGAFRQLLVAEPAWLRRRPGVAITTMVVDSPTTRLDGHTQFGFPTELGTLRWHADATERELVWEDRGISVRARERRRGMPAWLPVLAIQHLPDGDAFVPGRLWGWLAPARVAVHAPDGDPWIAAAGVHPGLVLSSFKLVLERPRLFAGPAAISTVPLVEPT